MKNNLCIVAGGSGGHIIPALVLANTWKRDNPFGTISFFSTCKQIDYIVFNKKNKVDYHLALRLKNFPGKQWWQYPQFIFQCIYVFLRSLFFFLKNRPQKIISTGGLIAIPTCLAAATLQIPIDLYELNAIPGRAVKALTPFAHTIHTVFADTKYLFPTMHQQKIILTKYPLRFTERDKICDRTKLITSHQFDNNKQTLFIVGGSQGSLFLNNLIKYAIEQEPFIAKSLQLIHQVGHQDTRNWKAFYKQYEITAHVFSYTENIKDFYLISDLVICRGGAGTLFELAFFLKKCLIFPLHGTAGNHQVFNAQAMIEQYPALFHYMKCEEKSQLTLNFFQRIMNKHTLDNTRKHGSHELSG